MKRVAAPERTRERLRALMDGRLGTAPARSNLVLLAAQLIVEEALEAEVRDEVGRERYERADGEASGYRNGYRTGRMKTAEGVVEFAAPQVRDTAEPFVSGIRQNLAGRTGALEPPTMPRRRRSGRAPGTKAQPLASSADATGFYRWSAGDGTGSVEAGAPDGAADPLTFDPDHPSGGRLGAAPGSRRGSAGNACLGRPV